MGKWKNVKIKELCDITTGKLNANAMCDSGKYVFFTCARETYLIDEYAFDTEAILISGNGANVGYVHYYKGKFNAYQRTYVLSNFNCDAKFLKYQIENNIKRRIYLEKSISNTPYIVLSTISEMEILIPESIEEQKLLDEVGSEL